MGVQRIAVIGLGTMGHGIAQTFAMAGCVVRGFDEVDGARSSAIERIRRNLHDFVAAGLIDEARIARVLSRITICESEADAVRDAECVVEAIREDLAVKQAYFARVEQLVGIDTILASNSSTIPISQSGLHLRHPERAVVTHWFNPPHIVPTVEIVGSERTSDATIEAMLELHRRAGKQAIRINRELPGFIVNRVQVAMMREVWDLLDRGVASAEDIDAAIQGSLGFRLAAAGPLRINDFGGLDVLSAVYRNLTPDIASGTDVPARIQSLVDAGYYGLKTGKGFYDYPGTAQKTLADRDARFLQLLKLLQPRAPDRDARPDDA